MSELIEFETEDGGVILIEQQSKTTSKQISRGEHGKKALQSLEQSLSGIKPLFKQISDSVSSIDAPAEVVIKFSFKLTAEAGVVVASAGTEAQFAVEMKWSKGK